MGPMASLDGPKILSPPGFDSILDRPVQTEMNTRNISFEGRGGKGSWCIQLTSLPPSHADCLEILEPQSPEPSGPVQACNGIVFPSTN